MLRGSFPWGHTLCHTHAHEPVWKTADRFQMHAMWMKSCLESDVCLCTIVGLHLNNKIKCFSLLFASFIRSGLVTEEQGGGNKLEQISWQHSTTCCLEGFHQLACQPYPPISFQSQRIPAPLSRKVEYSNPWTSMDKGFLFCFVFCSKDALNWSKGW